VVSGIKLSRYYGYLGVGLHDVGVSEYCYIWTVVHCLNYDLAMIERREKQGIFLWIAQACGIYLGTCRAGTSCDVVSLVRLT
jgi:hypothetical protein